MRPHPPVVQQQLNENEPDQRRPQNRFDDFLPEPVQLDVQNQNNLSSELNNPPNFENESETSASSNAEPTQTTNQDNNNSNMPIRTTRNVPHPKMQDYFTYPVQTNWSNKPWSASKIEIAQLN